MVTPGSTAPDASFTTPVMLPFICALADAHVRKRVTKVVTKPGICRPLIACPPCLNAPRGCGRRKARFRSGARLTYPWFSLKVLPLRHLHRRSKTNNDTKWADSTPTPEQCQRG